MAQSFWKLLQILKRTQTFCTEVNLEFFLLEFLGTVFEENNESRFVRGALICDLLHSQIGQVATAHVYCFSDTAHWEVDISDSSSSIHFQTRSLYFQIRSSYLYCYFLITLHDILNITAEKIL